MTSARIIGLQVGTALLLVVICVWAATQWAAAMLGHQPALGPPWIDLLGLKIYAPWKLFVWWLAFDAQAPDVFARAGAVAAFGGIASGAVAIGGAAWRAEPQAAKPRPTARPAGRTLPMSATAGLLGDARRRARPLRRPLPAPRRPRARPRRGADAVGQRRRPGAADAADLDRLRRHPRHQGRELAADRRLARQVLALPAVRPDQSRCPPASIRCWRCARARTRCATCRTSPTSWSIRKGRRSGATTGRRRRTRC